MLVVWTRQSRQARDLFGVASIAGSGLAAIETKSQTTMNRRSVLGFAAMTVNGLALSPARAFAQAKTKHSDRDYRTRYLLA